MIETTKENMLELKGLEGEVYKIGERVYTAVLAGSLCSGCDAKTTGNCLALPCCSGDDGSDRVIYKLGIQED